MTINLAFQRWEIDSAASLAPLFGRSCQRGIYIIEFANGERYVGKTIHMPTRFRTHAHGSKHHPAWPDIAAVQFAQVREAPLDPLEQETIRAQIHAGYELRNRTFNLGSQTPAPLDYEFSVEEQHHWIQRTGYRDSFDFSAVQLPQRFRRTKVEKIADRRAFEAILTDLAFALTEIVPLAPETELKYWTLSDLPSTNSNSRYCALNTGVIESLVLLKPDRRGEHIRNEFEDGFGYINTFTDVLDFQQHSSDAVKYTDSSFPVVLMRHDYNLVETVGVYYPLGKLADIMRAEPELLEAARAFAIENMRHRNGGLFRRFHSKALANKVYRQIKVGQ